MSSHINKDPQTKDNEVVPKNTKFSFSDFFPSRSTLSTNEGYLSLFLSGLTIVLVFLAFDILLFSGGNLYFYYLIAIQSFFFFCPALLLLIVKTLKLEVFYSWSNISKRRKDIFKITNFIIAIACLATLLASIVVILVDSVAYRGKLDITIANYAANTGELILILLVTIIGIATNYAGVYWELAQFVIVTGYNEKTKTLKFSKKIMLGIGVQLIIGLLLQALSASVIDYYMKGKKSDWKLLGSILAENGFSPILLIELCILATFLLYFTYSGSKAIISNKAFILIKSNNKS